MAESRISYEGSLDMASVAAFSEQVEAVAAQSDVVRVDFSELEFVDSTGIRGLVMLKQQLATQGKTLIFEGMGDHILDILELLGIKEMIVGK